jgi:hypothetical protein
MIGGIDCSFTDELVECENEQVEVLASGTRCIILEESMEHAPI